MADDVEEKDEEDWSEALAENSKNLETPKNTSKLEVSPSEISELPVELSAQNLQSTLKVNTSHQDKVSFHPNTTDEKVENYPKNPPTPSPSKPFKSDCHPRSRDVRQCQKHIQEVIGKHEIRNEELEQLEGDLRQRLQALETSVPAVMVWNIWRMAQCAPTSSVRRLMQKQFQGFGVDNVPVPTTPSQHWDERVRKIEAERKEALRRVEEARALLAGKEAAVHERGKRLEEAKKCHQEKKEMMEKLAREAAEQREALKNARGDDNSGESGENGKEKWLDAVGSVSSIGSTDLECFAKLQELAEAEICMKRQISELERREEAYMRTLQQADEMWSKMEGDTADTVSLLQDQLDLKTTANQQLADRICQLEDELENSKKKLISSKEALSKLTSKAFTEAQSGHDDSEADVKHRGVLAAVKTAPASTTAGPQTFDQESLAHPEKEDKESHVVAPEKSHVGIIAVPKVSSKTSEAVPVPVDQTHRGIDPVVELRTDQRVGPAEELGTDLTHRGIGPVNQVRIETPVGDEENIPEHWKNWNWDEGCPPDILCDDMVEGATETDECQLDADPKTASKVQATSAMVGQIAISPEELRNWYNIVDSLHHMIAKGEDCSPKTDDVAQLAAQMKSHLRIKDVAGVKGPMIMPEKILETEVIPSGEHIPAVITRSAEEMPEEIKSAVEMDGVDHLQQSKSVTPESEKEIDRKHVTLVQSTEKMQEEVKTTVPTDHIDLHDETEPHVTEVDAKIDKEIRPVTPTKEEVPQETMPEVSIDHVEETEPQVPEVIAKIDQEIGPLTATTEEMQQEIKPEAFVDDVDLPDESEPAVIFEEVVQVGEEIGSPTQFTDKMKKGIKTEGLIDHEDLVDETISTVPEEVVKTDKDISPVSAEQEETEPSDVLASLEKSGSSETEDVQVPAERAKTTDISATPVLADVETKTSGIADEIPDAVSSQIEVSEEEPKVEKLPVSAEESSRTEEKSAEVTGKQSEHEFPESMKMEVEFKEIPDSDQVKIKPEEIRDSEKIEVKSEQIPVTEEEKVESEVIPDTEKIGVKSEVIPYTEKIEVESEVIPDTEKEKVDIEEITDPAKVEVESEVISEGEKAEIESKEIPDSDKVKVEPEEIAESEEIEVESEEIPEPSEMISPTESVYTSAEDFSEAEFDIPVIADEPSTIKEPSHIPEGETLIEMPKELAEEVEEPIPVPKEDKLEFEDAVESMERPEEFVPETGEVELPLELQVPTEEEAPPSFVTPRTPPVSKIDVKKESKDEILAISDLRDDQSAFDVVQRKRSSEVIVSEEIEGLLLSIRDVPVTPTEPMPELDIPEPVSAEPEEVEKVSITKTMDYQERPVIIDAEGIPELEVAISKAAVVKADSETKPEIPEAGSQPDVKETERPEDKLDEDISTKEKITVDRPKAGKPYLVIAKVESWKKLELPKPMDPCICKPRICPLLGRSAGRRPKLKVVEVVTSGTQTNSSISKTLPGRMDKQKPKKLPERTRPSPLVAMWRRATISPRRPKDKSSLTTVCVDTQTDSTLVRGRIALQGITRKDDCTCSGACPRKPDRGGCIQRISNKPTSEKRPAPVSLATAQLISSTNFPTSMTSCAEKEICVVRYTGRSLVSSGSHLDCIECGRPITPGGTVVFTESPLPTTSTSQRSIMKTLKSMASSASRVTRSKDASTCCDCKTSGKLKTDDSSMSTRQDHKDSDKRRHDQDVCCPCPPKVAKKTSSKLSKKKRKPEMKDQSVMANIPKKLPKASTEGAKRVDVVKTKSPHVTSSKIKPSDTGTKIVSNTPTPGQGSYCSCDESSHTLNHSEVQSTADGAKTPKDNEPCDCFLMESVSKGSSCNCFHYNV